MRPAPLPARLPWGLVDDVVPGAGSDPVGAAGGADDADAAGGAPAAAESAASGSVPRPAVSLARAVAVYSGIRVGLLLVLTALLELAGRPFGMPLIVAVAFAVVLQLPIAVLLFSRQRHELTAALARAKSGRTAERDRLRAELTGRDPLD